LLFGFAESLFILWGEFPPDWETCISSEGEIGLFSGRFLHFRGLLLPRPRAFALLCADRAVGAVKLYFLFWCLADHALFYSLAFGFSITSLFFTQANNSMYSIDSGHGEQIIKQDQD
jgi:hypothetical protein